MIETPCTDEKCPVLADHTHAFHAPDRAVKLTIHPDMVSAGMWLGDCCAQYAIAMDTDNGDIVWHRSADWRTYAMHNGYTRVARISPEMPCSN